MRRGGLPVACLPAAVLRAPGASAGESSGPEGGWQERGEAKEGLFSTAASPTVAAAVEAAEQGPGQAIWHHKRYCKMIKECFYFCFLSVPEGFHRLLLKFLQTHREERRATL